MSPTTLFAPRGWYGHATDVRRGGEGVYPGYGTGWEGWEGYTGTHPDTLPGPILYLFQPQGPTYGQMKVFLVK